MCINVDQLIRVREIKCAIMNVYKLELILHSVAKKIY